MITLLILLLLLLVYVLIGSVFAGFFGITSKVYDELAVVLFVMFWPPVILVVYGLVPLVRYASKAGEDLNKKLKAKKGSFPWLS